MAGRRLIEFDAVLAFARRISVVTAALVSIAHVVTKLSLSRLAALARD